MNSKRIFQPVHQRTSSSIALLFTRLVVGTAFIIHGWVLGLIMPLASFGIGVTMAVAGGAPVPSVGSMK